MSRVTSGDEIGTSGVTVPTLHNFFWIVDDDWGYTTAPTGSVHAGCETSTMLNRACAWRRYHANFAMPSSSNHFATMEAMIPQAASAVGKDIIPVLVQTSASSGANAFPIKTQKFGGSTANSTNTATVGGKKGADRIAGGEFDTAYTNLFTAMKTAMKGQPWGWDMWQEQAIPAQNIYGGFQGGIDGTGQAAGLAAAQHVLDILYATDPLAIGIQGWTEYDPDNNKQTYWWGDSYVQCLWTANYRDSMARLQATHDFSVTKTVPFMLAAGGFTQGVEVKCVDNVLRDKDGSATGKSLIQEMLTFADGGTVPNLCGLGVWNFGSGSTDNHIDTSAASLSQYKALAGDAKMQSFYVPGSPGASPANIALPTLTPHACDTTSTLTYAPGSWSNSPTSFARTYEKRQASTGTVTTQAGTGTTIGSLTAGYQYRVNVTATNSHGSSSAVSSEWTAVMAASPANGADCDVAFPVDGGQVTAGTVACSADASAPSGVSGVTFAFDGGSPVDGTSPGGNGNGTWTGSLTVSGTGGSSHRITAVATPK